MKNSINFFLAVMLFVSFVIPVSANAATYYQPQTKQEMIAFLYGRIAQLMDLLALSDSGGGTYLANTNRIIMSTKSAGDVTDVTAVLLGEVIVPVDTNVVAWFEYGEDEDFLDKKTSRVNVRSAYDRAVSRDVRYLKPDERYYFRLVLETKEGVVQYGSIRSFITDEEYD